MDTRCIECLDRSNRRIIQKYKLENDAAIRFNTWYNNQIALLGQQTVELQQRITRKLTEITGIQDLYTDEKKASNQLALSLYTVWKPRVESSSDPLLLALKLAIAGNIMDYGAHDQFNLEATIKQVITTPFAIDHSELLRQRLAKSESLLYLADNAGEIVFDRLLLETIGHQNATLVVRGGPVLNDATFSDAEAVGIGQVASIISSGLALPSTYPEKSSEEMKRHFKEADLIISKGQGNLEGLIEQADPRIFFLLMAKCDVIAEKIGVNKGSFIVLNLTENA